jgi:hypothetical protein
MSCLPEDKGEFIETLGFPIVVNQREGYGSLHLYIVRSENQLQIDSKAIQKYG